MLHCADLWILDHVFQPLAGRLAGCASPQKLGRECLLASFGIRVASDFLLALRGGFTNWALASTLLTLVTIWYMAREATSVDQRLQDGTLNPLRSSWRFFRYIGLLVVPLSLAGLPSEMVRIGALPAFLNWIDGALLLAGAYLASCQKAPPPLPLGRTVGAGA